MSAVKHKEPVTGANSSFKPRTTVISASEHGIDSSSSSSSIDRNTVATSLAITASRLARRARRGEHGGANLSNKAVEARIMLYARFIASLTQTARNLPAARAVRSAALRHSRRVPSMACRDLEQMATWAAICSSRHGTLNRPFLSCSAIATDRDRSTVGIERRYVHLNFLDTRSSSCSPVRPTAQDGLHRRTLPFVS